MNQVVDERRTSPRRRTPSAWIVSALALLLVVGLTAAFGGFQRADATDAALPRLAFGEQHLNDRFSIAVTDAVVGKEIEGVSTFVDEDESLLVLTVQITNLSDRAFQAEDALGDTLVIPAVGDEYVRASRADDGTASAWLQPEIPTELRLSWPVPDGAFTAGQQIEIDLADPQRYELSQVATGTSWSQVIPAAVVAGPVRGEQGGDHQ